MQALKAHICMVHTYLGHFDGKMMSTIVVEFQRTGKKKNELLSKEAIVLSA